MSNDNQSTPANGNDARDTAEVCGRVAERAWDRFRNRQQFEWRYAFALWTLFAGGAAVILASGDPCVWYRAVPFAIVNGIVASLILWRYRLWLGHLDKHCAYDRETSIHFESEMLRLRGIVKPDHLQPPREDESRGWHPISKGHFWIASVLAALFVVSPLAKCFTSPTPIESRMTIEQGTLEIDGTSKLKLGR